MSGAQAKAAVIAGCVGVVAEVHKMFICVNSIWGGSKTLKRVNKRLKRVNKTPDNKM